MSIAPTTPSLRDTPPRAGGEVSVLRAVIHRDLLLALRRRADVATVLLFFVIVVTLFPLGVGPEPNLLRAIAPGVIWVAALLSSMLALARLFAADFADGSLEQLLLSRTPLGLIVAGKVTAHWLVSGLPLVVVGPVLALQFDLNQSALGVFALSLLIGTPVLSLSALPHLLLLAALFVLAAAFTPWAIAASLRISLE